jgi:hypothetical protein
VLKQRIKSAAVRLNLFTVRVNSTTTSTSIASVAKRDEYKGHEVKHNTAQGETAATNEPCKHLAHKLSQPLVFVQGMNTHELLTSS